MHQTNDQENEAITNLGINCIILLIRSILATVHQLKQMMLKCINYYIRYVYQIIANLIYKLRYLSIVKLKRFFHITQTAI